MTFLSRGFKNLQWYSMTGNGYKKDIARENPDFIGVFAVLRGKISVFDFVDVNQTFSLCRRS